ncbi:BCCT family transporter [Achromobacter xylosoxidans]
MTHPHHRFLDRLQGSAQAGQDNIRFGILDIHHPVFPISVAVIAAFVIFALLQAGPTEAALNGIRGWLTSTFDWLFMGAANLFVLFSLFLIFSPMGSVVIGGPDAKPEYSFVGWTSMLFATGMGIGLVFFGVMEPMHHFNNPPLGLAPPLDAQGQLVALAVAPARELAMAATVFHWGLHPWAIYAVVGLSLALITYNLRLPLSIRSVLYPILGLRHARGALGNAIDILAVFAVLFGLATSLGLGAQQALAGLHHLYGIEINAQNKIILVIVISAIALGSVVAGIEAGVKRLSELNVALALLLMLLIIAAGPTADILQGLLDNTAAYLRYLPQLSQPFSRRQRIPAGLDLVLLGLVDFLVALRRHVHRPHFQGPQRAPVPGLCADRADAGLHFLDDHLRRHRAAPAGGAGLYGRAGNGAGQPARAVALHDAAPAALGRPDLAGRDRAGGDLLRHLVGFRFAGHRRHHRRRQGRRAHHPAHLLGPGPGRGRAYPAAGRRAQFPAGRLGGHRLSIPVRAAPDDAVDLARAALVPSRRTPGGFPVAALRPPAARRAGPPIAAQQERPIRSCAAGDGVFSRNSFRLATWHFLKMRFL